MTLQRVTSLIPLGAWGNALNMDTGTLISGSLTGDSLYSENLFHFQCKVLPFGQSFSSRVLNMVQKSLSVFIVDNWLLVASLRDCLILALSLVVLWL